MFMCALYPLSCPVSLVLSTARVLKEVVGWKRRFYPLKHTKVNGCMDAVWTLHSLHCVDFFQPTDLSKETLLPPGNLSRIIAHKGPTGKIMVNPSN